MSCQYCFWWLQSVFRRAFLCNLRVVVSMRHCCLQCRHVLFLLLFLTPIVCQRHLWDVRPYAWSLVFLLSGPLFKFFSGPLQEWSRASYESTAQVFIPFTRLQSFSFVLSSFLVLLRYRFLVFFFQLYLSNDVSFQYSQVSVGFLFSKRYNCFLI